MSEAAIVGIVIGSIVAFIIVVVLLSSIKIVRQTDVYIVYQYKY